MSSMGQATSCTRPPCISALLEKAERKGQDLVLDVLTVNRHAQALYRRLGLTEVARHGDHGIKITMRSAHPRKYRQTGSPRRYGICYPAALRKADIPQSIAQEFDPARHDRRRLGLTRQPLAMSGCRSASRPPIKRGSTRASRSGRSRFGIKVLVFLAGLGGPTRAAAGAGPGHIRPARTAASG
jgi:hypothetical protein